MCVSVCHTALIRVPSCCPIPEVCRRHYTTAILGAYVIFETVLGPLLRNSFIYLSLSLFMNVSLSIARRVLDINECQAQSPKRIDVCD